MKKLSKAKINRLVDRFVKDKDKEIDVDEIKKNLTAELSENIEQKAILGIDIYRYSQYKTLEQSLIPYLLDTLLTHAFDNCFRREQYFFQTTDEDTIRGRFIDTGDGGFLIFDNPLQAILFSIFFQASVKRYNSGHIASENIRDIVGTITLRYSLTYDEIYNYSNNHYGTGIINNARILAKDKLNRFLTDNKTIDWFEKELNGIENLMSLKPSDFKLISFFKDYSEIRDEKDRLSLLFDSDTSKFLTTDLLHIGEIKSKLDVLNVFSLHMQVQVKSAGAKKFRMYTVSLGNLNSSDL